MKIAIPSCVLILGLALLLPVAPLAQPAPTDFPTIELDEPVTDVLPEDGPTIFGFGPFVVYRFQAEAGERYMATMESSTFNPFLIRMRPVGGITEMMFEDSMFEDYNSATLRFQPDRTGIYLLVAGSNAPQTYGSFTLTLEAVPPPEPAVPQPIAIGDELTGHLLPESALYITDDGSEVPHDLYVFDATAGQELVITMKSDDLDSYIEFGPLANDTIEMTHFDDDGGDGLDSRLVVTIPSDGAYGVVARSFGEGAVGEYRVRVADFVPPEPAVPQPIGIGEEVTGRLSDQSAIHTTEGGTLVPHDLYYFEATAGQTLEIGMQSDDLDSYLEFGTLTNGTFQMTHYDDDGGERLNALMQVTIPSDGVYGVVARSFGPGASGEYTVSVNEYTPRQPATEPIDAGVEVEGVLTSDDVTRRGGAHIHHWVYTGQAGQDLQIRMRSDEVDTYLFLGRMENGQFVVLDENDDAPDDGTNSLIRYTLPDAGEYVIRASTFNPRATGAYTIRIDTD